MRKITNSNPCNQISHDQLVELTVYVLEGSDEWIAKMKSLMYLLDDDKITLKDSMARFIVDSCYNEITS